MIKKIRRNIKVIVFVLTGLMFSGLYINAACYVLYANVAMYLLEKVLNVLNEEAASKTVTALKFLKIQGNYKNYKTPRPIKLFKKFFNWILKPIEEKKVAEAEV